MDTQADFPVSVALCGGRRQEVRIGRSTTWDQFRQKVREQARLCAGSRSLAELLRGERRCVYACVCSENRRPGPTFMECMLQREKERCDIDCCARRAGISRGSVSCTQALCHALSFTCITLRYVIMYTHNASFLMPLCPYLVTLFRPFLPY